MTALGWVVYGVSIVSVVFTLGLLLWTLQVRMTHELHGELAATYHSARPRSSDHVDEETNPIRPLPPSERTRFANDWRSLQPLFVNNPDDAVKKADRLISDVMQTRGYPLEDFAQGSADGSAEYPEIMSHYSVAHRLAQRAADGKATTDEERRALDEYRELFDRLLSS